MAPLADGLERAERESTRLLINTPPQHGKSELVFHWLAKVLKTQRLEILYITYSSDFSASQMKRARPIAQFAGVPFSDNGGFCEWGTQLGGSLWATGIGGSITGRPGKIIVIDDPIKDWESAQSKAIRERTDAWLRAAVLTRIHPDSSVIIVQTRWHEDDITGRLEKEGWERINLPAINDEEEALWPEQRPLWWLREQEERLGPHIFSALYQGRPQPIGGEVFQPPTFCDSVDIPRSGQDSIGVDLAYTAKTKADYSVSLILRRGAGGNIYVADVVRKQVRAPDFAVSLRAHANYAPGAPMVWYCAGSEQGSADFIRDTGIPLRAEKAIGDKFVRAQPVAAAWNAGKILVPRDAPWTRQFVDEITSFTGYGDDHDDQVDALAAAFDFLGTGARDGPSVLSAGQRPTVGLKNAF